MHDVDEVISRVCARLPDVEWSQLQVTHRGADDAGLWFFLLPETGVEVQIESTVGVCPFLIESTAHEGRLYGATIERTVEVVVAWLQAKTEPPQTASEALPSV
jgi:hypothetical protein